MQFIVLICLHPVVFSVVFMSNLEWSGLVQAVTMFAHGFLSTEEWEWAPWGQPVCQQIRCPMSWHSGALLNYALSLLHTRHVFPAS